MEINLRSRFMFWKKNVVFRAFPMTDVSGFYE